MILNKEEIYNNEEYMNLINDILQNDMVQKMNLYRQHYNVSCYEHCLFVSYNSYLKCKKLGWDYKSIARAGMVHDLFLYDWRKKQEGIKGWHAFTHPKIALENAKKIITINEKEKDIILKHMWPVVFGIPKYKETFLITYVDKIIAIKERKISYSKDKEK